MKFVTKHVDRYRRNQPHLLPRLNHSCQHHRLLLHLQGTLRAHRPLPTPPNRHRSDTLPIRVIDDRPLQTPFPSDPRPLLPFTNKWRSSSPLNSPTNSNQQAELPLWLRKKSLHNDDLQKSTLPSNKTKRSRSQPPSRMPFLPPLDVLSLPDPYPLRPRPINPPIRARMWSESTLTPATSNAIIAVNTDTTPRIVSTKNVVGATTLDTSLKIAQNILEH